MKNKIGEQIYIYDRLHDTESSLHIVDLWGEILYAAPLWLWLQPTTDHKQRRHRHHLWPRISRDQANKIEKSLSRNWQLCSAAVFVWPQPTLQKKYKALTVVEKILSWCSPCSWRRWLCHHGVRLAVGGAHGTWDGFSDFSVKKANFGLVVIGLIKSDRSRRKVVRGPSTLKKKYKVLTFVEKILSWCSSCSRWPWPRHPSVRLAVGGAHVAKQAKNWRMSCSMHLFDDDESVWKSWWKSGGVVQNVWEA